MKSVSKSLDKCVNVLNNISVVRVYEINLTIKRVDQGKARGVEWDGGVISYYFISISDDSPGECEGQNCRALN